MDRLAAARAPAGRRLRRPLGLDRARPQRGLAASAARRDRRAPDPAAAAASSTPTCSPRDATRRPGSCSATDADWTARLRPTGPAPGPGVRHRDRGERGAAAGVLHDDHRRPAGTPPARVTRPERPDERRRRRARRDQRRDRRSRARPTSRGSTTRSCRCPAVCCPALVRLPPLLGIDELSPAAIRRSWSGSTRISTPLGVGENGVFGIDLVRDGPHGLVGGTTGSGKSEFLRSMVAGLAARNDPTRLTFILIDFKGGAAFKTCERLPHTIGTVSNLDEQLADRALTALEAELRYRQQVFARAGEGDRQPRRLPGHQPERADAAAAAGDRRVRDAGQGLSRRAEVAGQRGRRRPHPRRAHDPGHPAPGRRGERGHPGQHQPAGGAAGAEPRRLDQRDRRPGGVGHRSYPVGSGLRQARSGRHHPGADRAGHRAARSRRRSKLVDVHPVRFDRDEPTSRQRTGRRRRADRPGPADRRHRRGERTSWASHRPARSGPNRSVRGSRCVCSRSSRAAPADGDATRAGGRGRRGLRRADRPGRRPAQPAAAARRLGPRPRATCCCSAFPAAAPPPRWPRWR